VRPLHGVDAHFAFVPPPTDADPGWTAASSVGIGDSMASVRRAADGAVLPAGVPVTTLSVTTAWLAFTVVVCCTTICCFPSVMVEPLGQHRYGPRGFVSELQVFRTRLEILCVV
jgi:hypothetical protein